MNTYSDYVKIGRKADGTKVYVKARFGLLADQLDEAATWREDVNHNQTTERLRLAFQSASVNWNGSIDRDGTWQGCGQGYDELLLLTELEPGWTVGEVAELHATWKRWHLNDMRAACAHQHNGADSAPCEVTGYRYGRSWLYESLPFSVVEFVSDRFGIELPTPGSRGTE